MGPQWALKLSSLSITAKAFTFFRASQISSLGKGRKERTLIWPTFLPWARSSLMASLAVPAEEPMMTMASSASSII